MHGINSKFLCLLYFSLWRCTYIYILTYLNHYSNQDQRGYLRESTVKTEKTRYLKILNYSWIKFWELNIFPFTHFISFSSFILLSWASSSAAVLLLQLRTKSKHIKFKLVKSFCVYFYPVKSQNLLLNKIIHFILLNGTWNFIFYNNLTTQSFNCVCCYCLLFSCRRRLLLMTMMISK
jgi:hypothetical protein